MKDKNIPHFEGAILGKCACQTEEATERNALSARQAKGNGKGDEPTIGDLLQQRTEGKANFMWDTYRGWGVHVILVSIAAR